MFNLSIKTFWISFIPLLLSLLMALFIAFFAKSLPPKLPLFYSLSWGEKQLADPRQLFIIPATMAMVGLFNLVVSRQLHPQQAFFKKILLVSALLVSLILTITFCKIVLIFI